MSVRATTIGFSLLALFLAVVPLTAVERIFELRLFMLFMIYAHRFGRSEHAGRT